MKLLKEIFMKSSNKKDTVISSINNEGVICKRIYPYELELRNYCKNYIESFEHWSRRLIQEKLSKKYGDDFYHYKNSNGEAIIKADIIKRIEEMVKKDSARFPRLIDALFIDDISYFFCKNIFYNELFKDLFDSFFSGIEEIRSVLNRITIIRNKLSHGNPISYREAEQVICYTNDFIDCFKEYYKHSGSEKKFNVPQILKATDSFGNCSYRDVDYEWTLYNWKSISLRSGETYKIWIEVDPNFAINSYNIVWNIKSGMDILLKVKDVFEVVIPISNKMVGSMLHIECYLITKKDWHKYRVIDDKMELSIYDVLPPISENY